MDSKIAAIHSFIGTSLKPRLVDRWLAPAAASSAARPRIRQARSRLPMSVRRWSDWREHGAFASARSGAVL